VVQDGRSWLVASHVRAAHRLYTFHVPVVLPSELRPGTAILRVDGQLASVRLHILRDK
jgi:hypothetical protein